MSNNPFENETTQAKRTNHTEDSPTAENQKINIDPDILEHIRSLKTKDRHPSELTNIRFAVSFTYRRICSYLYQQLPKNQISLDALRENLKQHRENFEYTRCNGEKVTITNMSDDDLLDILDDVQFNIPHDDILMPIGPLKFRVDDDKNLITLKRFDEDIKPDKALKIMEQYLQNSTVVDLGGGRGDFLWEASIAGANEYIAIDDPDGQGEESDKVIEEKEKIESAMEALGVPFKFCPHKRISGDILEMLYTKIPDNSVCCVLFGVDESYHMNREYIRMTDQLLAEKTKVGGIVLCCNSVTGYNMPDNFELLYDDGYGMGVRIYLRKK